MRVVPSKQHRDCGISALACALDISYEHAQHLLFPSPGSRKKNWNVNVRRMVIALRNSGLVVWHSSELLPVPKPQDAETFLDVSDFGPVFLTKVKMPCHEGTPHWHWVVILATDVYDPEVGRFLPTQIGLYERQQHARFCGYIGVRRRWPDITT